MWYWDISGTKIVIGVIFVFVKRINGRVCINYMKFDKLKLLVAHFILKKFHTWSSLWRIVLWHRMSLFTTDAAASGFNTAVRKMRMIILLCLSDRFAVAPWLRLKPASNRVMCFYFSLIIIALALVRHIPSITVI